MKSPGIRGERQRKSKAVAERKVHRAMEWILFFYSVPSKPVKHRMKIWRKLAKIGAVQLKGSVYILPYGEENYEMFQWLASEVMSMGGEGAFIKADRIETMEESEITDLFNRERAKDYQAVVRGLEELEVRIGSVKKGSRVRLKSISDRINKLSRNFEEIQKIDFFSTPVGTSLKSRFDNLRQETEALTGYEKEKPKVDITRRDVDDYQRKTWVTRTHPFVDRMSTAWLIRRFIDSEAVFDFIDERDLERRGKNAVAFDIKSGDFTHVADMCTFEVILKSFGINDRALKKIAEIVHELDLKDGKFDSPEARGVEEVLRGIRKVAKGDSEMLEKGMEVFDMLYVSMA
jgi:hypothetical protein